MRFGFQAIIGNTPIHLPYLETLSMRSCGIVIPPRAILQHAPCLRSIDLSDNKMICISSEDIASREVVVLRLGGNHLRHLPGGLLNDMTKLSEVDISRNGLSKCDVPVQCTPHLTVLCLSHNSFTHLPLQVSDAPALSRLLLDHNELRRWPQGLDALADCLTVLHLEHNRLQRFPREILHYTELGHLSIDANPFLEIDSLDPQAYRHRRAMSVLDGAALRLLREPLLRDSQEHSEGGLNDQKDSELSSSSSSQSYPAMYVL